MINFKSIPFFKILLPYCVGIFIALQTIIFSNIHTICIVSFAFVVVTFLFQKFHKPSSLIKKSIFIISVNVFLFFLAFESCFVYNAKNNPQHYSYFLKSQTQRFIATIDEIPVTSEKYTKLYVKVNAVEKDTKWNYAEGKTIIYVKNSPSSRFSLGNVLLLNAKFSYLTEPKNPNEFDYKSYLESKNIFHTVFSDNTTTYIISNPGKN